MMPRERARRERATATKQRDETLFAAVCAVCGGLVRTGEGVIAPGNPWADRRQVAEEQAVDDERRRKRLPPLASWRRRHADCATTSGIVRQLTGIEVSDAVAGLALAEVDRPAIPGVPHFSTPIVRSRSWASPVWAARSLTDAAPRRWAHVPAEKREKLRAAAIRERDRHLPKRCASGPCGWCGVERATSWHRGPETWSDGSPAPLCADCHRVWDRGARPADQAGRRARALEALSGTGTFDGDGTVGGEVMRAFAEVADADRHGYDERWAYAPGPLARIREAARLTWPSALPEPMRTAYREKAAQARAAAWAEANQRAIADAEAQVKQAGWR